jgi:hypothetical protein
MKKTIFITPSVALIVAHACSSSLKELSHVESESNIIDIDIRFAENNGLTMDGPINDNGNIIAIEVKHFGDGEPCAVSASLFKDGKLLGYTDGVSSLMGEFTVKDCTVSISSNPLHLIHSLDTYNISKLTFDDDINLYANMCDFACNKLHGIDGMHQLFKNKADFLPFFFHMWSQKNTPVETVREMALLTKR